MRRVLAALAAKFAELQPACRGLLVFSGGVVAVLAITALQRNNFSRHSINPFRFASGFGSRSLVHVQAWKSGKQSSALPKNIVLAKCRER
jgi:hypothetical protein